MITKLLLAVIAATWAGVATANDAAPSFSRQVRPILSNKCFECHGPDEEARKARLRLDVPDGEGGALSPRDTGHAIVAGDPEQSEVWRRIVATDESDLMPPPDSHKERLTSDELDVIRRWILDGAPYQKFWSFMPPVQPMLPVPEDRTWGDSFIDRLVLARLESEGLRQKAEADKRTLIRRVTFDLTGLPPTLEDIESFVKDEAPDAYERLVDTLLERPAYGEHMTRYWADLVRLADTNGMHKDFFRDFSPYRDWIIQSFNRNLPFDDFIKYQLAGDLYEKPSKDQLTASGYNRLHLIIDRGTALPEESLFKNVVDQVQAFGTVFLGLTVQCAQCHDHKYDPISRREYYEIFGFFNNFSGEAETEADPPRGLQPPFVPLTTPLQDLELAKLDAERDKVEQERRDIHAELAATGKWPESFTKVTAPWIWNRAGADARTAEFRTVLTLDAAPEKAMARFTAKSQSEVFINGVSLGNSHGINRGIAAEVSGLLHAGGNEVIAKASGDAGFVFVVEYGFGEESMTFATGENWEVFDPADKSWKNAVTVTVKDKENAWAEQVDSASANECRRKLDKLERTRQTMLRDIRTAMVMEELDPPRQPVMYERGAYDQPGEAVERNTPDILPPLPRKDGPYSRMDLAEWLVSPGHPLTARVAVNRFWQQFFGVGLVKTSEDFGAQGEWPSHPELLDALAIEFVRSGWNVKSLLREIVLSNTYKQSSDTTPEEYQRDPENRLLARGSRYRMDAEMLRDQILAVSGRLNDERYGQSVKPPQPPGLWEMVSMAAPFTYVADTGDDIYRRSLYTFWRRAMPPPQMTILNAPSREYCVARRERTNTPLQALLMMNEPEWFELSQACAERTLKESGTPDDALARLYERITSQVPNAERLDYMRRTLDDFREIYAVDPELTKAFNLEAAPGDRVELAAWTMLTHSLLNLELAKVRR